MNKARIYFLDNLRSTTILLVVIFHAAMAFITSAPDWWYVVDTQNSIGFDIFILWSDVFIMPIMFFISGYFGIKSMVKRSTKEFWKGKIKRIGLPWIFGAMVFAPMIGYMRIISRKVPMSFKDFYFNIFWGIGYEHAQYWYLGALITLYLLLQIAYSINKNIGIQSQKITSPGIVFFIAIGLTGSLGVGLVNKFCFDGLWLNILYILKIQPTRVPLYILYFALGVYAYREQWFTKGYCPRLNIWLPVFIITSLLYIGYKFIVPTMYMSKNINLIVNGVLHSFLCMAAIMGSISIFKSCANYSTPKWAGLSMLSYPIYYIHQQFVQLFNLLIRPLHTNVFLKFLLVSGLSISLSYLISKYILIKIPAFNTKKSTSSKVNVNI